MIVDDLRVIVLILTTVIFYNACGESVPKSSVVFVIDKTNSMGTVIRAVKSGAKAIFDTVAYSDESPVENFILVTFGDPNVSDAFITTNHDEFKKVLSSISLENGSDCPELSMTGIKKGIEAGLPGSYIYVFTDASAKDFDKFEQVKRIAQAKDCQVVFILTGKCKSIEDKKGTSTLDDVYSKLASATSGQVFNLLKQDIAKILLYVKDSIRSRRVILHTGTYSPGKHKVHFKPDVRTEDMTIAISGSYPEANVIGPDGETVDADVLVNLNEILIVKVDETTPGDHRVDVSSEEPAYVLISAKSDVKFRHGFSTTLPSTLNDTVFKPVSDVKNYLFIKLYGENVQLTSAKFLTLSYHTILEIPLTFDEKKEIYVTNLVSLPKTPFRIAVKGIDKNTKTTITRYGTMILEPDKFVNKNPTVKIEGDNKVTVEYDGSLELKCKVNAYPEPKVIWKDINKGTVIPATESVREPPYNFISILEVENVNENNTYECFAVNRLGIGKYSVQVEVKQKPYFKVLEKPTDIEVDYNAEAVFNCKVDAFPPANITWLSYAKKRGFSKLNKVAISPDGSKLTIKHMQPSLSGTTYVCKAENDNKILLFPGATVTISSKTPKINKTSNEIHVKEGDSAFLNCSILESKPKPEIKWYRKLALNPSAKYMEVVEARNQTNIKLKNVNSFDTAIYKCRAGNVMGIDVHTMNLFVECPPTIKDDSKIIIAKEGEEVNLTCIVHGIPAPTLEDVVWLKDGKPLGSEIKCFRDHSLKFVVDPHHKGKYTCTAKNKLGSAQRTVQVIIYSLHLHPPLKSKIQVKKHRNTSMKCLAEGEPEPTLQWIYFSFDKTIPPMTLSTRGSKLTLSNIKENQRGYYTCVASNIGGSLNITYEVDVVFPPEIQSDLKPMYRAVDGDRVLKVHCRATGNPKPGISWHKDGMPLAAGDRYLMEDDWLVVKNVKKSDTAGDYYCEAKNKFLRKSYFDTGTFKIIVDRCPPAKLIKSTSTVLIREGEISTIECFVPHSDVDIIIWYKDGAKFYEGKLILDKAKFSDSGVYTCRVNYQNLPTIETANTKVIVGSKPEFVTKEETIVETDYGQFGFLNCKVLGEPTPTVTWWYNNAYIKFSEMVYNFKMDTKTAGKYTCEVTNNFGNASRTFDVILKGCFLKSDASNQPIMITTSGTWPTFKVIDGYALIPKHYNVMFSCPNHFTKFEQSGIKAQCDRGTNFNIDGALVDYTDIQCNSEVKSHISRKRKQCYGKDTSTVKTVFNLDHKTIEVFAVCVDGHGNPIYAKHTMRSPADYISKNTSISDDSKLDGLYSCRNQKYTFSKILKTNFLEERGCCFSKRHLVNPKDVFLGPAQRATFSSLNVVPHWSSCHDENWNMVEENVRKLAKTINKDLIVYTGTAGYLFLRNIHGNKKRLFLNRKTHQPISTFLWKVIQCPAYRSSLAIIQLNIPYVSSSELREHVLCRDICQNIPWMRGPDWRSVQRGYTYCCELKDFEMAFEYMGVFEPFTQILNIAIKKKHTR